LIEQITLKLIVMKTSKKLLAYLIIGTFMFTGNIYAFPGNNENIKMDIVNTANSKDILKTLLAAVQVSNLTEILQADGPFTILAPTNEAFAQLPEGVLFSLVQPENKEKLIKLLANHVISGEYTSAELLEGKKAKTVQGNEIKVNISDNTLKVNGAKIMKADIKATNGIVHVVDQVILPPIE